MTYPSNKEFSSPQQALKHYGVLGMKWGRTRVKATGPQIRAARRRLGTEANKIHDQRDLVKQASTAGDKAVAREKLTVMKQEWKANPDRIVASRLTRGEKAVAVIFLPGGVSAVAVTSIASRRIERKHDLGLYDEN